MRKFAALLTALLVAAVLTPELRAQCIPDTVNCVDTTGNPGEICPLDLPDGTLNVVYDETVTIIPPGSFPFWGQELQIFHIEIDSVKNLPPGIGYFPNADTLFPDSAYCIQLFGTPTATGKFDLAIYIKATIDFGGPVQTQVVNDSSLSITVVAEVGLDPNRGSEFKILPGVPNPFHDRIQLSYYSPGREPVDLSVYNVLGSRVYHETVLSAPGTHNFRFDGSGLQPGTYLYRVGTGDRYFTGKLMKSR